MSVHHYGIWPIGALSYLYQTADNRGWDALGQGMEASAKLDMPPETTRLPIPHQFDLSAVSSDSLPPEFLNNAIVDLYLPKPLLFGPPVVAYIKDKTMDPYPHLKKLADLSCLMPTSTRIFETALVERYAKELRLTNIGPVTLVGVQIEGSTPIYKLSELAKVYNRHLVIAGHPDIPIPKDAQDYTSAYTAMVSMLDDLRHIDFRKLGSTYLRAWAQYQYNLHSG